ncbi:MAG: hypothetical protein CMO61_10455 [Verrucomicrobiales bacterium]|nr:hypothetical protein [Verrucomicrobiales bacterium]
MPLEDHNALLKSVSRSFYLSMRLLPAGMRETVSLGYLLARLSDTVADASGIESSERLELLNSIRLLIEGSATSVEGLERVALSLEHPGEAALLKRQADLFSWYQSIDPANREHLSEVILTIIHGQTWDATCLEEKGIVVCEKSEDLLRYTYWVAGCVGEFWTKVGFTNLGRNFAAPELAEEMLISGRKLGQALQLVNILRDLHEDLPAGRCYLPRAEMIEAGWTPGKPVAAAIGEPVFKRWASKCEEFLEAGDTYSRQVNCMRARLCTRLPKILARKTLSKLELAGFEAVISRRIKVPRSTVWQSFVEAFLF